MSIRNYITVQLLSLFLIQLFFHIKGVKLDYANAYSFKLSSAKDKNDDQTIQNILKKKKKLELTCISL